MSEVLMTVNESRELLGLLPLNERERAAAEEREACARLVEEMSEHAPPEGQPNVSIRTGKRIAAAIRERGEK